MPRRATLADVEIDVETRPKPVALETDPGDPFRILLLGNFSGRRNRGPSELVSTERCPVLVDRDNFEAVMKKMAPRVTLAPETADAPELDLQFTDLDHFHPDHLYDSLPVFAALRELRKKADDPAAFRTLAAELAPSSPSQPAPAVPEPEAFAAGSLLDQILENEPRSSGAAASRRGDPMASFLRSIVAPYLVPGRDPKQDDLVAHIDNTISARMRAILHADDFQALESLWRVVFFLTRRLETGTDLKLYLLDLTREEFAETLAGDDLRRSELYRLLVDEVSVSGTPPWAVIATDYTFDNSIEDVELLGRIALIAERARAPFLGRAHERVLGVSSLASSPDPHSWSTGNDPAWSILRELPESRWLALALPRFLLRLPYGKETSETEQFAFEEMEAAVRHESYLWGNPGFACAMALGQAFSEYGWGMEPGAVLEVGGLPVHTFLEDGTSAMKPCAEVWLTDKAIEVITAKGLIPLISKKGSDSVRLGLFQSVCGTKLGGRWTS